MNLQQSQTSNVEYPEAPKEAEILLHGRWLLIARVGWIALTLLILTLNIVMIPRSLPCCKSTAIQARSALPSP